MMTELNLSLLIDLIVMPNIGIVWVLIVVFFFVIIGAIFIRNLTNNLKKIVSTVEKFNSGELTARIEYSSKTAVFRNLAENINNLGEKLSVNANKINSIQRFRQELIANVSHDLRTPLTAIQGYAETLVLLDDKISIDEQKKYTNYILSSTDKLKKLVEDLFELSKLESHQVQIQLEEFSINEMISDIIAKHYSFARSKGICIEFEALADDTMVLADIGLVDKVVQHLVENALIHTPINSCVTIEVAKNDTEISVIVKDNGLGISSDELPFIFDRYKKARDSKKSGSGLGLAIVKNILALHGSEIHVSSIADKGTTITFGLPYSRSSLRDSDPL